MQRRPRVQLLPEFADVPVRPDLTGNGSDKLVVIGYRTYEREYSVTVKGTKTGALIQAVRSI